MDHVVRHARDILRGASLQRADADHRLGRRSERGRFRQKFCPYFVAERLSKYSDIYLAPRFRFYMYPAMTLILCTF